jgi:hypothetical protein
MPSLQQCPHGLRDLLLQLSLHQLLEWLRPELEYLQDVQLLYGQLPHLLVELGLHIVRNQLRGERERLRALQQSDDGLSDLLVEHGVHELHQHDVDVGQRRLSDLHLAADGLSDLQLEDGLHELLDGVRAEHDCVHPVQSDPAGLRDLQLDHGLHGLRGHLLRAAHGLERLRALRQHHDRLCDLQLQLGLPQLRQRLRPQRLHMRPLHFADVSVQCLLVEVSLHELRKPVLRLISRSLPTLQHGYDGVRQLQLGDGLPKLLGRLRAQRFDLRDLRKLYGRLFAMHIAHTLHSLRQSKLRNSQQQMPTLQYGVVGLLNVQFEHSLPHLRRRLCTKWLKLRHLRVFYDGLLELQLSNGLQPLPE